MHDPGRPGARSAEGNGGSTGLAEVDPYLRAHLRLAERQSLLQGRHISTIQSFALVVLNHLDELEKAKDRNRNLKLSMVAQGVDIKKLFPEYFPEQDEEETDGNAQDDYRNVEWKSPKDAEGEFDRLMSMLGQGGGGVLNGEDVVTMPEEPEIEWTEWR